MFIGGLSNATTNESLALYFTQFGQILDCVLMTDKNTNKSRGFAYITFFDSSSVQHVLNSAPHILDDKQIDCKLAVPKDSTTELT